MVTAISLSPSLLTDHVGKIWCSWSYPNPSGTPASSASDFLVRACNLEFRKCILLFTYLDRRSIRALTFFGQSGVVFNLREKLCEIKINSHYFLFNHSLFFPASRKGRNLVNSSTKMPISIILEMLNAVLSGMVLIQAGYKLRTTLLYTVFSLCALQEIRVA